MSPKTTTAALAAVTLLSASLSAQTMTSLGQGIAQAISADGTTVAGGTTLGAWSWTASGGQQPLPGSSWAYGVSGDGSVVFGEGTGANAGARWTSGAGWQGIGAFPGTSGACGYGSPYALSDSGDVGVGLGWDGCSAFAYKWTPGGGVEDLGQFGPFSSRANAVSGDGTVIGGWDEATNGTRRAAVWFDDGSEVLLLEGSAGNPFGYGEVSGLSSDGSWATGIDTENGQAFRWSAGTGVELLGNIPGFPGATGMAISDDGATVVGFAGIAFSGLTAIIWTESGGMQTFSAFASGLGINLPAGEDFQVMHDLTANGRKIVGYHSVDAGPFSTKTPVLVDLGDDTWTDLGGGTAGLAGTPELVGTGPLTPGSSVSLDLTNAPPSALMIAWLSFAPTPAPALGGTVHALPFAQQFFFPAQPDGTFSVTTNWPAGVPSNTEVWFQFVVQDASVIWGLTLSNGLKATTP